MASGGVLIYMSTRSPGSGGSSILAGQEAGLCTADTDLSLARLSDSAGSVTYRKRRLVDDVTTSQSADLSKGSGFLAASIDGEFTIQDADGLIAADIEAGHINPVGWDVWIGYIPAGGAFFDVIRLVQMKTVDHAIAEGVVRMIMKSPAYIGNQPLYGVRTISTLSTGPDDPANPTDPTYLDSGVGSQFAGVGFGSREVSLKAAPTVAVNKLAYYQATALATGSITTSGSKAEVVATTATAVHNSRNGQDAPDPHLPYENFGYESLAVFECKDRAETVRLYAQIKTLAQAGYSIVVSDGQWFLDISALDTVANLFGTIPGSGVFQVNKRVGAWERNSIGPGYPYGTGVVFTLDVPVSNPLTAGYIDSYWPPNGIDAGSCSIFAVPSSVAVASQQSEVLGFARNGKTLPSSGATTFVDQFTTFTPNCASADGFVSVAPVDASILFNPNQSGNHLGGILEVNNSAFVTLSGAGDLADISMDPLSPWTGGAAPVTFGGSAAVDRTISIRLNVTPSIAFVDGDVICVESTWKATFTAQSGGSTHTVNLFAGGPFKRPSDSSPGIPVVFTGGTSTLEGAANPSPKNPRWDSSYSSISDMTNSPSPFISADGLQSISMDLMECFIFAYSRLNFSSIYTTIYPFWTRKNLNVLATDGTGNVLAGGAGVGVVASDGSISWTPFDIAPNANGAATVKGAAYGASTWAQVGFRTPDGATFTNCFWYSNDGATWTEGAFPASAGLAWRVRYVGGYFIALYAVTGAWKHSLDGVTWVDHASIAGDLNDVVFDGTKWHFIGVPSGGGGFAAWTASITSPSFTVYSPAAANAFACATVFGGYVVAGASGGQVWRCPVASLASGSWTNTVIGSSEISEIAQNALGMIAVSADGIWHSTDGATWSDVSGGHLDFAVPPAVVNTVVGSESIWIVGADAQIVTARSRTTLTWIPWGTRTPSEGLAQLAGRYFGGLALLVYGGNSPSVNPVRWTEPAFDRTAQNWGVAFDPPSDAISGDNGSNADSAARKIAQEWWIHAGEMSATRLDGSNDPIEEGFPEISLGNIEDVATIITVQYAPFGGDYLKSAYVQNVDVDRATAGKPDEFFFKGWDATGNTNGLAIWTASRATYLKTQILRAAALSFDSVHDEATLGKMWTTTDTDIGQRIAWLCSRPQYLRGTVDGNDSQAALAQCGCRYKPNFAMLQARGLPTLGPTGYGVVVQAEHNYTQGTHSLDIAFPPV